MSEKRDFDITICMPYFERRDRLEETIAQFRKLGYFEDYGLVLSIVDDGSTKEPLSGHEDMFEGIELVFSRRPNKTNWECPSRPLNQAIRQSNTPILLLQSPEIFHPKPIIGRMIAGMTTFDSVVSVSTKMEGPGLKDRWYSTAEHTVPFWWCQMMSRAFYNKVGGFDDDFSLGRGGEDVDFAIRASAAGAKWKWLKDGYVIHNLPERKWPDPNKDICPICSRKDPNVQLLLKRHGTTGHRPAQEFI